MEGFGIVFRYYDGIEFYFIKELLLEELFKVKVFIVEYIEGVIS